MSRRSRAFRFAAAIAVALFAIAFAFARLRNPNEVARTDAKAPTTSARLSRGEAAFRRMGCETCHSVAGRDDTGIPLDGVGSRLDAQGLRDWTLGEGPAAGRLSAGVKRRKAGFADDPDLPAVLEYLAGLK